MRRRSRVLLGCASLALVAFVVLAAMSPTLIRAAGGAWTRDPAAFGTEASPAARDLVERALAGLDTAVDTGGRVDRHVHLVGLGAGGTGCEVNPAFRSWWHPTHRVQFLIYASAAGIDDLDLADAAYVERLLALARAGAPARPTARLSLAFDRHHRPDGSVDPDRTEFYVPNERVLALGDAHPDVFEPVGSVHPYRADAITELDRLAARGVRWIKWLPNAMGIDPADARCDPYYERMAEHRMILLSHAGVERAVHAAELQALGNPLRLRRALEHGVKVVVAHCASLGDGEDLDAGDGSRVPNFELFLRMMGEERWNGLLFGEISAMTLVNRRETLGTLLARTNLHERLVDGSDYPMPAINAVIWLGPFESEGFLTAGERAALAEIYDFDPLLFDLVLKRTLRHPETGARFPDSVFLERPELDG